MRCRHTCLGSALNKRWKHSILGDESLFDRNVRSLELSIFSLAVTIIRIHEWVNVRQTFGGLASISTFIGRPPDMHDVPTDDVSEWLETVYDRDDDLESLT